MCGEYLAAEGGDEEVAGGQQVQVHEQPGQRQRRVAAVRGGRLGDAGVAHERVQRVLAARVLQHAGVVGRQVHPAHGHGPLQLQRVEVLRHVRHVLVDVVVGRLRAHLVRAPDVHPADAHALPVKPVPEREPSGSLEALLTRNSSVTDKDRAMYRITNYRCATRYNRHK